MRYEKHDCPLKGSGPEQVVGEFRDGHITKRWLTKKVVPMLSKMVIDWNIDETPFIYIDTLLGTRKLSFRLESSGDLVENWFIKEWKKSLRKLGAVSRIDRVVNLIMKLKGMHTGLMYSLTEGKQNCGLESVAVSIGTMKDLLVSFQRSLNSVLQDPNVAVPDSIVVSYHHRKAAEEGSQSLKSTWQERVRGKHQAIDVIADAELRSIDAPPDPPKKPSGVYLCLGLSNAGKMELVHGLSEHLLTTEGKTPLIQVDLSDKLKSQSLLEEVAMPYCVILFDKVEKADASVFRTLVRVLYTGMLSGSEGVMVVFRNTTIIIISDLGDKEFISRLLVCSYPCSGTNDQIQQRDIAGLPMTEGRHLTERGGRALGIAFMNLFGWGHDMGKYNRGDSAVYQMSIGLIRGG